MKKLKLLQSKYSIYPRYSSTDFNIYPERLRGNRYLLLKQVIKNSHVVIDVDKFIPETQRSNILTDYFIIKYDEITQTFICNKEGINIKKCYATDIDKNTMLTILKLVKVNSQRELSKLINDAGEI